MSHEPPPLPTPPAPETLEAHVRELATLAEIMLGAAYSDGRATWPERSAIAGQLAGFLGHKELPEAIVARIQAFDPKTFDLETACRALIVKTPDDRVQLLTLISRVTDADARLNLGERSYLERVAGFIGATREELEPFVTGD